MSTAIGRQAEAVAAEFLRKNGHKILAQNWRTRWCEIDIVTQKGKTTYFVEVKYRKGSLWGDGLEYITYRKRQQIIFAAEFWLSQHKTMGECRLVAISMSGEPPRVNDCVELEP